jgi:hypothetical protein
MWFPVNHLLMTALERFHRAVGDDFTRVSRGSGRGSTLAEVVLGLGERLVGIDLAVASAGGRRPVFGGLVADLVVHLSSARESRASS